MLDLAIDYNTGDLLIAPNNDIAVRTGAEVIEQKIRVRLRIYAGEWALDPTGGSLGSHLRELSRVASFIAVTDAERIVREALGPMTEIAIHDVTAQVDPKNQRRLVITLQYDLVEPGEEQPGGGDDTITLTTAVNLAG